MGPPNCQALLLEPSSLPTLVLPIHWVLRPGSLGELHVVSRRLPLPLPRRHRAKHCNPWCAPGEGLGLNANVMPGSGAVSTGRSLNCMPLFRLFSLLVSSRSVQVPVVAGPIPIRCTSPELQWAPLFCFTPFLLSSLGILCLASFLLGTANRRA